MFYITKIKQNLRQSAYIFKENVLYAFSFDGKLSRSGFILYLIFINAIFSVFGIAKYSQILSYVADMAAFYCVVALLQKRCRDFGSGGTFWILLSSVAFITSMSFHFINITTADFLVKDISLLALLVQLAVFLTLAIIPSKENADLSLNSPLLKYPFLYVAICWGLAVASTISVNCFLAM